MHLSNHINKKPSLIGIVGPCAAGKTTLTSGLKTYGYSARPIAQEHSYAPAMWKIIAKPDVLIFLEVSYENTIQRRNLNWTHSEYIEQLHRLRHARESADFSIDTNSLTIPQVLERAVNFLRRWEKTKKNNSASE